MTIDIQTEKIRYAAIIALSKSQLLRWLDFEGGIIHRIYQDEGCLNPEELRIVVEHPDLPVTREYEQLQVIKPEYLQSYEESGVTVERIAPPKRKVNKAETISDGFGSEWSAYCNKCKQKTMSVVRPGKVQCSECG